MKEAAGEANMTVITIVLIAIVLGIGTVVVTNLMESNKNSTACQACGGVWNGGKCWEITSSGTRGSNEVSYEVCKNPNSQNNTP